MTTETIAAPPAAQRDVVLVPGDRFFVWPVPLLADTPAASQVELALEEHSPFPLAQLLHGYVAPRGDAALAYASYRRRFEREEVESWTAAEVVLPTFLALLGSPP